MATQRVKNQHYVSQFYLRHFSLDQERFFVFDKPTGKIFPRSIEEVASTDYFYEIDPKLLPPGTPFQIVEKTLGELEGQFGTDLKAFLTSVEQGNPITDGQREFLANWISLQEIRTLEFRTKYQQMMVKGLESLRPFYENATNAHELKDAIKSAANKEELKLEQAQLMFGDLQKKIVEAVLSHYWFVGRTTESDPLYTSDAPFVRYPHIRHPILGTDGIASRGIELAFPLSSRFVLVMLERGYHNLARVLHRRVVNLDPGQVSHYNFLQTYASNRQVYCASNQFVIAQKTVTDFPECRAVDRSRVTINGEEV